MMFYSNGKRIRPRKKVIRICLEYRGATEWPQIIVRDWQRTSIARPRVLLAEY